jgi:uncharacterized RDD family membrane protein YckC
MSCTNHPEVIAGLVSCGRCGKPFCQDCVIELDGQPYDAACKEEQVRDLRSGSAELAYATATRRWGAMVIDYSLFFVCYFVAAYAIRNMASTAGYAFPEQNIPLLIMVQLVLPYLCFALYEGFMTARDGQTIGKRALGIKVVNHDGSDMEGNQVWKRAGSRWLITLTLLLPFVDHLMVFSRHRRTLHDRFAKTVVVKLR